MDVNRRRRRGWLSVHPNGSKEDRRLSSSSRTNVSPLPYRRRPLPRTVGAVCLLLAACDVPTEIPQWDTRWVIPAERTAFSVSELLPEGIDLADAGGAFEIPLAALTLSSSLGEMCPACRAADGLTVPKPAFTVALDGDLGLPEELISATLNDGAVEFQLRHDFPFDPLRPAAGSRGYLLLTVTSGSVVLARDSLDGRTTAFPAGGTLAGTLPLAAGEIGGPLQVGLTLHSPAGDPVRIDVDDRIELEVPAARVGLSQAVVRIEEGAITTPDIVLELGDVDEAISGRVREGALRLALENPFDITGAFELRITAAGLQVVEPIDIAPGESAVRVALTGEELRAMLGQNDVRVSLAGAVSSPPSGTELFPEDEIAVTARLELVVSTTRE
jgi:hypothetical protein